MNNQDILNDIAGYEERISEAKNKLSLITTGYLPYLAHKKRELQRKELEIEVSHVKQLIGYAEEALIETGGV